MVKRLGTLRAPSALAARLGPLDAAAIVVSNVIGGGIFFVPQVVAGMVPHPWAVLGVWLLGGLLSFAGAMAYAELAAARPRAGAEYVYLRDAFGRLPAFLTGWTSFVAGFSGAIAASAVALAEYLGRFVPAAGDATPLVTVPLPLISLVVSRKALVALVAIAALSFVHVRGLGPGRLVQNTLAGLKVSGLLLFVALGLSLGHGHAANLSTGAGPVTAAGVLLALVPVMFTYSGWNAAAYVAEEVRDPGRNVPRALALGTAAVTLIYLALNVLFLYATPVSELSVLQGGLIDGTSDRLFTFGLADWIAAFTIVSIAASISAMTIAGPRVYFAMARDGLFLGAAARVHPRFHTPTLSIVAQALWSGVLVLCGTLSQLLSYTGFAVVLFSGVAVVSLFVLRRRDGSSERPYSAWGYPVAPAIFVLASAVLVLNEIWSRPGPALAGLGVMAAGVPVYWWTRANGARFRTRQPVASEAGGARATRATLVGATLVAAALGGTAQAATAPAQATAVAVEGIRVDGVLDPKEWARAVPIGVLVQRDPVEGAPASEETEVRVAFDGDNLYFGILCRDRTPDAIVATQLGRDADLAVDDRVTIVLDPFFDQRNGFFFSVNPAGARADGQISNNEQEPSLEWDGIWDARTRITSEGWAAEVALPFKTLRFKPGQTTWGLNVERQIKRLDERDRWASARFDVWISNLAESGQLGGLAGLQQGRGLDIRPYVSGGEETNDATGKVGLDVSKSLTPSLTASLTVNTDFAETEVDARQINLSRFDLFFPEKRTFFLEGAGIYDVAGLPPAGGMGPPPDLVPFFSRTIGLLEGQEVPILFGAKVSGRQSGFNIGVLDVQTRQATADSGELPGQNLLAARVSRNFFEQSWVGAIVTHGDPTGAGDNTLLGVDARLATSRFRGGKNLSLDAFALRTDDGARGRVDHAYGARLAYPNDRWSGSLGFKRIGDGFRPALGFAPRTGIWKYDGEVAFQPRLGRFGIRQLSFRAAPTLVTNLRGDKESWEVFTALPDIEFESGEEVGLNWLPVYDRLTFPFEIRPGVVIPPGSYRWSRYQAEVSSATKRPWVVELALWWGGFYGGTLQQLESGLTLKPSTHLSLQLQLERNDVELPEGDFVTQLLSARVDYSASPNITWSNLVQYDSDSRSLGFQSRFRWILRPGNDLFLVVSRGWYRRFDGDYLPSFDKGSAKLQYTFRL